MADQEKETKNTGEDLAPSAVEDNGGIELDMESEVVSLEESGEPLDLASPQGEPTSDLDGLLTTIDDEITKFLKMVNGSPQKEATSPGDEVLSETGDPSSQSATEPDGLENAGEWDENTAEMLEALNREYDEIDLDDLVAAIDEEIDQSPEAEVEEQEAGQLAEKQAQFIIFSLAGVEYAVPATNVTEVGEMLAVTPLPNVPQWLKGVANLRGDIISIVDLRTFLQIKSSEGTLDKRLLITRAGDQEIVVGLIVDKVNAIRYLPTGNIEKPTGSIEDNLETYLQGVLDYEERMLTVLDFEKLLLSDEMQQFRPA